MPVKKKRKVALEWGNKGVYEVEEVLQKAQVDKLKYYCVKWLGYDETTWEPTDNLNCSELVQEYEDYVYPDSEMRRIFWKFACERQEIWDKKNNKSHEIYKPGLLYDFRHCHFANVYRELDAGTKYFHDQVRIETQKAGGKLSNAALIRMATSYRLVNKVSTFEAFKGIPCTAERIREFVKFMRKRQHSGKRSFTHAHQTGGYESYYKSMLDLETKIDMLELSIENGISQFIVDIEQVKFVGGFFAQQISSDLHECGLGGTSEDWVVLGPGAKAGVTLLFPGGTSKEQQLANAKWLQKHQRKEFAKYDLNFPFWEGKLISLKNIEHLLCEFKKFYAMLCEKDGATFKRRKYHPTSSRKRGLENEDDSDDDSDEYDEVNCYDNCYVAVNEKPIKTEAMISPRPIRERRKSAVNSLNHMRAIMISEAEVIELD